LLQNPNSNSDFKIMKNPGKKTSARTVKLVPETGIAVVFQIS
jgi:hypothetical protein